MLIAQISDSHIAEPAADHDRAGDLMRCVAYVNGLDPAPELVVHTGDISHNGKPEEYRAAGELLAMLDAPQWVIPGNRDDRTELRKVFAGNLADNCHPHFIQYRLDRPDICLVMLDTVSGDSNTGRLCAERLSHLTGLLDAAGGKPVMIFMHHPPFDIIESRYPFQFTERADTEAFAAIVAQYPNVRSIHCGHSHRPADGAVSGIGASTIPSIADDLRMGAQVGMHVIAPLLKSP